MLWGGVRACMFYWTGVSTNYEYGPMTFKIIESSQYSSAANHFASFRQDNICVLCLLFHQNFQQLLVMIFLDAQERKEA